MTQELKDKHVAALVRCSSTMLKAFREGKSPTFEQLDRLETVLFPFTNDKLCGHPITDDCNCEDPAHD